MEYVIGDYRISNDKSLLSMDRIYELLSKSYWADKRPREATEASILNSICYGIYKDNEQVGFARIVTDYATVYYLCDVFIDESHRGHGLGKALIKCIVESDELKNISGILITKDAHGLYEKYGFEKVPDRFMKRAVK